MVWSAYPRQIRGHPVYPQTFDMKRPWKFLLDVHESQARNLELNHRLLRFTSVLRLSCKIDLCKSDALADVRSSGRNVINFAWAERFLSCQATNIHYSDSWTFGFHFLLTWGKSTLLEELQECYGDQFSNHLSCFSDWLSMKSAKWHFCLPLLAWTVITALHQDFSGTHFAELYCFLPKFARLTASKQPDSYLQMEIKATGKLPICSWCIRLKLTWWNGLYLHSSH